jgi:hypothetical protein
MSEVQVSIGISILVTTLLVFAFFTPLPALLAYALSLLVTLASLSLLKVLDIHQKK